jgi:hypothetical protein
LHVQAFAGVKCSLPSAVNVCAAERSAEIDKMEVEMSMLSSRIAIIYLNKIMSIVIVSH